MLIDKKYFADLMKMTQQLTWANLRVFLATPILITNNRVCLFFVYGYISDYFNGPQGEGELDTGVAKVEDIMNCSY